MKIYQQPEAIIESWQWGDAAMRNLTGVLIREVKKLSPQKILDAGCGSGRLTLQMAKAGFAIEGVDFEPKALELAEKIRDKMGLKVVFHRGSLADDKPPALGQYDAVICSEVLEHIPDYPRVVKNLAALTRPGGYLLVTVPKDPELFSVLDEYGGHLRRFEWRQLQEVLEAEFEILDHFTVGFPFMLLMVKVYLAGLKLGKREHQPEELWRSSFFQKIISRLMYGLCRVDNLFNRTNWGTNWVVKARKK